MTDGRPFPGGSRVEDLDLSDLHLHGVNLEGTILTDTILCGTQISGDIEGLLINGVDIEPLVRAELDRRFPGRASLRSPDVQGLRDAWSMLEDLWTDTTDRARRLPVELQLRRVGQEWSFVETLRHLIFATDCWLFRAVQGARPPYHRWGLPWSGVEPHWAREIGLDLDATPELEQVLAVRCEHQRAVQTTLDGLTESELSEIRTAPDDEGHPSGEHPVLRCLHVLLNEEWEHHRYALRDLEVLESER